MAKQTTKKSAPRSGSTKKAAKKVTKKKTSKTTKKAATKKPAAKKPATKKATSKKTSKQASKKPVAKKSPTKKPTAKKPPANKPSTKKTAAKKPVPKTTPSKATPKPTPSPSSTKPADPKAGATDPNKPARKGITIVTKKPLRRAPPKKIPLPPVIGGGLAAKHRKPIIQSGPKAPPVNSEDAIETKGRRRRKSPFNKKQLDQFAVILHAKRAELFGDVANMEGEALRSANGSSSPTTQHPADQGSDTYEQTLSLDLAAADRKLIKEIDDALERITDGSFGLCELTGQPISQERLDELPWTRYSIDGARQIEGHQGIR